MLFPKSYWVYSSITQNINLTIFILKKNYLPTVHKLLKYFCWNKYLLKILVLQNCCSIPSIWQKLNRTSRLQESESPVEDASIYWFV